MKAVAYCFCLIFGMLNAGLLYSQTEDNPCENPSGTSGNAWCAAYRYQLADDTLNMVWRQLMAEVPKEIAARLKTAQLHWIALRDQHCDLVLDSYGIGSGAGQGGIMCKLQMTQQRTQQLSELIGMFEKQDE